jgi:hypothetical protein
MKLPRFTRGGDIFKELTADKLNAICDAIQSLEIVPSSSVRIGRIPGLGTTVEAPKQRGGSGSAGPGAWDMTQVTVESVLKWRVIPGAVAGIIPSNILDTYSLGDGTLAYWICTCTTDGKQITSAVISTSASPPAGQTLIPSSLPATAEFCFAMTQNGIAYRTIQAGNPDVVYSLNIITDKTSSPPIGVPGVDRWYNILFS